MHGHEASSELFEIMFRLYTTTVDRKWGQQYLSSEFFQMIHQVVFKIFQLKFHDKVLVTSGVQTENGFHNRSAE